MEISRQTSSDISSVVSTQNLQQIQELRKQIQHLRQNLLMQQQRECKLMQQKNQLEGSVSVQVKIYQKYLDQSLKKIKEFQQKDKKYLNMNQQKNEMILNDKQMEQKLRDKINLLQKLNDNYKIVIRSIKIQKGVQINEQLKTINLEQQILFLKQKLIIKQKEECNLRQKIKQLEILVDKHQKYVQTQKEMQMKMQDLKNVNYKLNERILKWQQEQKLYKNTIKLQQKGNDIDKKVEKQKQQQVERNNELAQDEKIFFVSAISSIQKIDQSQSLIMTLLQIQQQISKAVQQIRHIVRHA